MLQVHHLLQILRILQGQDEVEHEVDDEDEVEVDDDEEAQQTIEEVHTILQH